MHNMLEQFGNARILVIGDMMIDHYIWGDVHRISPEAPVPVVRVSHDTFAPGGAANVALNLANLGVETSIIGYSGMDEAGIRLTNILSENGIRLIETNKEAGVPTIVKTRVIARSQQLCRVDREVNHSMYRVDNTPGFNKMLEEKLGEVDAVIISDYSKGIVTQKLVDQVIEFSSHHPSLLVSVDPKPYRNLSFKGAGLLTPNRSEAFGLAGLSGSYLNDDTSLEDICQRIYDIHSPRLLIVTLGAEGMAICRKGKIEEILPTKAREVFDVSGAGDTVIATLTAALATGMDYIQATKMANLAAGCVISHMGTVPINRKELEAVFEEEAALRIL
jgi:D-glycero-beta-D-manno-heptose-7-phosphate kinase